MGPLGVPSRRNVMALANVRYNTVRAWFSDMRELSLEHLPFVAIESTEELGNSTPQLVKKLGSTDFYPPLFQAAFGTPEVTADRIGTAIAQFLRSMLSYRTKFDHAYNPMFNGPGDPASVLTAQEYRGLQIFQGASGITCSNCHDIYGQTNVWQANNGLDAVPTDPGTLNRAFARGGFVGVFRAASLRNIALTAPYMHDGRFATLREVIDHYDHGIAAGINTDGLLEIGTVPGQMHLTEEDKQALEAFLNTLTDTDMLSDPKFTDPFQ